MYYGLIIDGVNTLAEYGLALGADLEVPAPQLRENRVTIPGRDGTLNLSYALTGYPIYEDRILAGSLAKTEDDISLEPLRTELLTAYQGKTVEVILPTDLTHAYRGVFQFAGVSGYNRGVLKWTLTAEPYRLKLEDTEVEESLTTTEKTITLTNEGRPVIPEIVVTAQTAVTFGSGTYTLAAGTHHVADICLREGDNTLTAKTLSGTGTITFTYREGVL